MGEFDDTKLASIFEQTQNFTMKNEIGRKRAVCLEEKAND